MQAPLPDNEDARLQSLRDYEILDTAAEAEFDDFTALAAHICGTPIALISLIDEGRQWFKSKVGLDVSETPRDQAFCAHAIRQPGVFTVPDAQADARFADNPLVTGETDVRFYAGAPLLTEEGHALGTLCVIDHTPRTLTAEQERALQALSRQVIARLELRRHLAEREAVERELRDQEEQYRLLFENAAHGIYRTTPDGRILLANPALLEMLGYDSLEQLAARNLEIGGTEAAYTRDDFKARLEAAGELRGIEAAWERRDGRMIFVRENAHLVRSSDGRPLFYEGSVEDITAYKEAEEALWRVHTELETRVEQRTAALAEANRALTAEAAECQQIQEQLAHALQERESVMETVSDILFRLDLSGRLVQWNRKMETITGLTPGELQDRPSVELFPASEQGVIAQAIGQAFQTGYAEVEGHLLARAGVPVLHQFQGVPLRDAAGSIIGLTGMGRDITESRRQQAALAESEQRYRSLVEHSPDGIVVYSGGCLVYLNAAARKLFGAETAEQLLGRPFLDMVHPIWHDEVARRMRLSQREGQGSDLAEFQYLRVDGSAVDVEAVSTPIQFEGRPAGQVLIRDITGRKQNEQEIYRMRRQNEMLLASAGEGIYGIDKEGRTTFVNPAAARMLGWDASELIGKPMHALLHHTHPDGMPFPREDCPIHDSLQGGGVHHVEDELFWRQDGSSVAVEYISTPLHEDGQIVGAVVTFQDITKRKQEQASLAESEQRYRSLVDHSPEAIIVYTDSRIVYLNTAAVTLFAAANPGELLGRSVFDFVHPDYHALARERAQRSQEEGTASALALQQYIRLDGRVIDVESVSTGITYQGKPAGQVLIRDITERRRAEEQVRATNDMRQLIIDNIPQFIFWKDKDSVYLGCNQNFAQGAGLRSSEEVIGKTDYDLAWKAEEADGYRAMDRAVMQAGTPQLHILETQQQADGRDKWIETNKIPLRDAQGRIMGILGTFQDVTDRKRAEEQIRALNAELFQAYDATIEGWSRALDYRDHETEGHSRRVTELTLRLARAFGVGEDDLVHVQRGALLHDIGKMAVPDRVLLKPGPLDAGEWELMRRHPAYAQEMLGPIAFLRPALDIPFCHHEKWDGEGYPRGLAGDDIPLAARLFAVVDVWDALRSDRPYRRAWERDRVLDHIRDLSGTHFDPQVVAAFLDLMAETEQYRPLARAA